MNRFLVNRLLCFGGGMLAGSAMTDANTWQRLLGILGVVLVQIGTVMVLKEKT